MCLLYMFQFAFPQFIQSDSSGHVCPICLEAYFFDVKHFNSLNVQSTSHLQGDSRILELAKYNGATWSIFHPIRQVFLSNSFCIKDIVFFFLETSGNYTALSKELLLCYHSQTFLITRGDSLVVQSAHPMLRLFNSLSGVSYHFGARLWGPRLQEKVTTEDFCCLSRYKLCSSEQWSSIYLQYLLTV